MRHCLEGDADDIDLAIANLTLFNELITAQVKDWYTANQNARLESFLASNNYTYVVNHTMSWNLTRDGTWNNVTNVTDVTGLAHYNVYDSVRPRGITVHSFTLNDRVKSPSPRVRRAQFKKSPRFQK